SRMYIQCSKQKARKIAAETTEEPRTSNNLQQESERPVIAVIIATNQTDESIAMFQSEKNTATIPQNDNNIVETNVDPLSATNISISEQELLREFRTKIN
ncbi:7539_t:CDS:2, partial [Racocetra fulgida]